MKKILSCVVVFLFTLLFLVYNFKTDAMSENEEFDVVLTVNENEYSSFNSCYDDAINLSPNNYYLYDSYKIVLNGTLTNDLIDSDFYYFKLLTDCNVSIEATSLSNYDFELALLYNECTEIRNNNAYHNAVTKYDGYAHDKNKNFEGVLKPGTYYILFRGIENQSIINSYELTLKVNKTDDFPEFDIGKLRHRNIKGAIWASDFIPGGTVSLFNLCDTITYYQKSETNLDIPNYALDDLRILSNGGSINVYNYFLWDPVIIYILHEAYVSILNELNTTFAKYEEVTLDLRIVENTITQTIELVGDIAGVVTTIAFFNIPDFLIDILGTVLIIGVNRIFELLLPKVSVNTIYYYGFLNGLVNALDQGINKNNLDKLQNLPTPEPLVIPIYYSLDVEENIFSNFTKYTFTLNNSIEEYMGDYSFVYNENKQRRFNETNYYCRGKLYAITDYDEIYDISKLNYLSENMLSNHIYESSQCVLIDETYHLRTCSCGLEKYEEHAYDSSHLCIGCGKHQLQFINCTYEAKDYNVHEVICECGAKKEEVHIGDGHNCDLCGGYFGDHSYGVSYSWVSYTKHKSFCECGIFKSEGHAIISTNLNLNATYAKCVLCGGSASIGFIEIKNILKISKNGSILLDNGIIILDENDFENYINNELLFLNSTEELLRSSEIVMYIQQTNLYKNKEEKD